MYIVGIHFIPVSLIHIILSHCSCHVFVAYDDKTPIDGLSGHHAATVKPWGSQHVPEFWMVSRSPISSNFHLVHTVIRAPR